MEYCSEHKETKDLLHNIDKNLTALSVRVNGSITEMENHMEMGSAWRVAIIGVIISIALQIITFSYLWGQASKQIAINTERLDILEEEARDARSVRFGNMTRIEDLQNKVK